MRNGEAAVSYLIVELELHGPCDRICKSLGLGVDILLPPWGVPPDVLRYSGSRQSDDSNISAGTGNAEATKIHKLSTCPKLLQKVE